MVNKVIEDTEVSYVVEPGANQTPIITLLRCEGDIAIKAVEYYQKGMIENGELL